MLWSITVRILSLLIGYALGCFQSAYIFGKFFGHIDIREHGSGNAGFTNTTRVLGKKVGIIVFICDIIKLIIAYCICSFAFEGKGSFAAGGFSYLPGIYAGIGAVLGHNFPFYLKFKGGKGIACTLALMLCIDWKIALITFAVGFVVYKIKHYISLSSLVMTALFPLLMIVFKLFGQEFRIEEILLMFLLTVLAYVRHASNIQRLAKGEENKFSMSFAKEEKK